MDQLNSTAAPVEKSFLVTVLRPQKPGASTENGAGLSVLGKATEEPLDELRGLAEAADTQVVGEMIQRRATIEPATYIGSGKVQELKAMVEHTGADVVMFDDDLAPSQTRNLERN